MQTKDLRFEFPGAVEAARVDGTTVDLPLRGGGLLRIDVLSPHIVRVRLAPTGRLEESLAVRAGFARERLDPRQGACRPGDVGISEDEIGLTVTSPGIAVRANRLPLRLDFLAPDSSRLTGTVTPWIAAWSGGATMSTAPRPAVCLAMAEDEHYYGLGFHRSNLDCRGRTLEWTRTFRHRSATVPFFMSSRGYGFLSNNTWKHVFDFSVTETPSGGYAQVAADGGQLDFTFIHGPGFREILGRYTDLTGRPGLPPRFALGLLYICRYFETQAGVLAAAEAFRRHDIPCDMIGLEPGWEDVPYAMDWRWSPERFPDPAGMVRELAKRGFALELWESGDAPTSEYADPEVRRRWFTKRLAASVDIGVAFFKQDDPYPRMIASEELQNPELGKPLGASGGEDPGAWRNVTNSLFSETLMEEFRKRTGRRTMAIFNGYTVSLASHRWPAAWAADYAAGTGLLNASLSAHAMVCQDMRNGTPAGIHLGFLLPFSIVDAWAYYIEPWLYPPHLLECHRFYAKLRHRLAPYLYSTLHEAHETGVPCLRPLVLDSPREPFARELATEHMLGEWLLVGHERAAFLPRGTWFDFWTGERHESAGQWVETSPEEPAGGPLFVRGGALIPTRTVSPYLAAEAEELLVLHAWPAAGRSRFLLREDDGLTHDYERGAVATTSLTCRRDGRELVLSVGARQGRYAGMPEARTWLLCVHLDPTGEAPERIAAAGRRLEARGSREELLEGSASSGFWVDAARGELWIKPQEGWRLGPDARGGGGDPERDSLIWAGPVRPQGDALEVSVSMATVAAGRPVPRPEGSPRPRVPADRLHVAPMPPERIALRHGDWLPRRSSFWVTLMAGDLPARGAEADVLMEVIDEAGATIRAERARTEGGRVRFGGVEFREGSWRFRFSSPGLAAVESTIRPAPPVPGRMA